MLSILEILIILTVICTFILAVLAVLFFFTWRRKGAKTRAELRRMRAADI